MVEIIFNNPKYLWFLLILPIFVVLHMLTLKFKKTRALKFANFEALSKVAPEYLFGSPYIGMLRSSHLLIIIIRLLTLTGLIFAVAGTVILYSGLTSNFDFVLAIDTSSSMIIDDFSPSRLASAKTASLIFADSLSSDANLGIVSFSGLTKTDLHLTNNKEYISQILSNLSISRIGGTDIGGAIIAASNLLKNSKKSKSIILITDGRSNLGTEINDAISYAKQKNVIVNTVGMGTEKGGSFGKIKGVKLTLDEESLKQIANNTNGKYLRAKTSEQLSKEILKFNSSSITIIKKDLTIFLSLATLFLLLLEWSLVNVKYRTIP